MLSSLDMNTVRLHLAVYTLQLMIGNGLTVEEEEIQCANHGCLSLV